MLGMSNYVHTTKIKDDMIGYKERRETWEEVLYHIAHNVVLFLMPWMQHKVRLLYFSEISLPNKYQKKSSIPAILENVSRAIYLFV